MKIRLQINGNTRELETTPTRTLLDVLRDAGYYGVKRGCEEGTCGSCVVLMDGEPHMACLIFAPAAVGKAITTIEDPDGDRPHAILRALADAGAVQCGYCIPGMALSAKALLDATPDPNEEEIRGAMEGHLCRCTGYVKQVEAIKRAAELMREEASHE
ncbi:MAG: (2Fe-2S)-binding protein [Deltaproteobacteria bacterium]|nr:(2Fe-2S)-binding protein [Deltaproteobacteria bacterium]